MVRQLLCVMMLGFLVPACAVSVPGLNGMETASPSVAGVVPLPAPRTSGDLTLEESIAQRRSIRDFSPTALTLAEVSQLLWAGQGITSAAGGRSAPSAGALYPLELYLIAGNVGGLAPGIYHYLPQEHEIALVSEQDARESLTAAALGQAAVRDGAISIVITAVYERTTGRYGERGVRFVHLEAGHADQNIGLQATALSLGAVTIGAFGDSEVKGILSLPENESPLYIIPVGSLE